MNQKVRHDLSSPCPYCSAGPHYICGHLSVAATSRIQQTDVDATVLEKMISNTWDHFGDVLPTLKAISRGEWYWGANQRCKYIEIRIDTRDGGCLLFDSQRLRISPEQFAHQSHDLGKMDPWPAKNALGDTAPQPAPAPLSDDAVKDAARYRWLFDARTEAQVTSVQGTVFKPLPQDEVLSCLQGFYMSKADVDALVDAAVAAQGGK